MENLKKLLAKRIKALRKLKNLTQEETGERSGISCKYIGELEREQVNPSLDILCKIAHGFDMSLKDLLDFPENQKGLYRENILYPLSRNEFETVGEALKILQRIFKPVTDG